MKNQLLKLMLASLTALALSGCGSDETTNEQPINENVISESQIHLGDISRIHEDHIVILHLEHPDAVGLENDLHEVGSDCYTFTPKKDLNDINLGLDENGTIGNMDITNLSTQEYFSIDKLSINSTFSFIKDKEYEICIHHNGIKENNQTIFMKFQTIDDNTTTRSLRDDNKYISKLINTHNCDDCNLSKVVFSNNNIESLRNCTITNSNLSGADFEDVNLDNVTIDNCIVNSDTYLGASSVLNAKFINMDLTPIINDTHDMNLPDDIKGISFMNSNLAGFKVREGKTLEDVDLTGANLTNATLKDVTFNNVTLTNTNLTQAALEYSDFSSVQSLEGAVFNDATITDIKLGDYGLFGDELRAVYLNEKSNVLKSHIKGTKFNLIEQQLFRGTNWWWGDNEDGFVFIPYDDSKDYGYECKEVDTFYMNCIRDTNENGNDSYSNYAFEVDIKLADDTDWFSNHYVRVVEFAHAGDDYERHSNIILTLTPERYLQFQKLHPNGDVRYQIDYKHELPIDTWISIKVVIHDATAYLFVYNQLIGVSSWGDGTTGHWYTMSTIGKSRNSGDEHNFKGEMKNFNIYTDLKLSDIE